MWGLLLPLAWTPDLYLLFGDKLKVIIRKQTLILKHGAPRSGKPSVIYVKDIHYVINDIEHGLQRGILVHVSCGLIT